MGHCGITCMDACTRRRQMRISRSFPNYKRQHLWIGLAIRLLLQSHLTETKSIPSCSTSVVFSQAQAGSTGLSSTIPRSVHPSLGIWIWSVLKISIQQMLLISTSFWRTSMTRTLISPPNTSRTWMRRVSNLGEVANVQRNTFTSEAWKDASSIAFAQII